MRRVRLQLYALIFLLVIGCSTNSMRPNSQSRPNYDQIAGLGLGTASTHLVENILGKPDRIVDLGSTSDQLVWLFYFEGSKQTRASLFFHKKNHILLKKVFFLEDADRIGNLSNIKSVFSESNFEVYRAPQTAHFVRDEWIYEERDTGRKLVSTANPQQIGSISWRIPDAKQANR